MMSGEPPAATVTIKRTGRDGYVCALATHDMIGSAAAPAARCKNVRRGNFIVSKSAGGEKQDFGTSSLADQATLLPVYAVGTYFVPEDRQCDVLALELAMDACPVRLDLTTVTLLRAGIGKTTWPRARPSRARSSRNGGRPS